MEKTKLLLIIALLAFVMGHSQSVFKGRVLDETNNPLPGASVVIKGGANGVATDFDGKFKIGLPSPNSILVISFFGYLSVEFDTTNKTDADIILQPDAQRLDEAAPRRAETDDEHVR